MFDPRPVRHPAEQRAPARVGNLHLGPADEGVVDVVAGNRGRQSVDVSAWHEA